MSRSAAGRAGGRPAGGRARPGARTRAALLAGLSALALLAPLSTAAPEAAAATDSAAPGGSATPDDDTRDPARPVEIEVTRLEPRSLTPGSTVVVAGTLTNTGNQTIRDLGVRLQRGQPFTSRSDLTAADRDPGQATTVVPTFQPVAGELEPGDTTAFSYSIAAAQLQIERAGVYPALVNLNGTIDGGERRRVGELSTYLVEQPQTAAGRATVAWLWPLVERTHRTPSGGFADDGLARAVSAGGRLDRDLSVIEQLPRTVPAGGSEPAPSVPVTLAVDPALIEELTIMAAGPYAVDGVPDTGKGTDAAKAFLGRLRTVAADYAVVALPYGDVDVDTLEVAGLGDVVTRSLPGNPAATAEDPVGPAGASPTAPTSGAAGDTPADGDGGTAPGPGAQILADALGTTPRTDLAWAPDGTLHPETLTALQAGGIDQAVLPSGAFTDGDAALGLAGDTAAARTSLDLGGEPLTTLVADAGLSQVVGSASRLSGGVRIAEQRYLAELATLAFQAPADPAAGPTVLMAPPREVSAAPEGVASMMADTAQLPWLRPVPVTSLADGPAVDAGTLAPPAADQGLDPAGLADVAAAVAVRDDFAAAVVDATALAPYDAAISRTTSVSWRDDAEGFRTAAAALRGTLERLRERVTLLAPADGTYSLASSDAPLVLTVRNDLPFAVRVRLDLKTRGNIGLTIGDIGPQTLGPNSRTTLQVPTQVRQSGRFAVTARLMTPEGGPLGDRVQIQVRSTAYGPISLVITIGAAALLGLLFLRRLIRFLLRRRRGTPPPDDALPPPSAEGATVSPPPVRSPV